MARSRLPSISRLFFSDLNYPWVFLAIMIVRFVCVHYGGPNYVGLLGSSKRYFAGLEEIFAWLAVFTVFNRFDPLFFVPFFAFVFIKFWTNLVILTLCSCLIALFDAPDQSVYRFSDGRVYGHGEMALVFVLHLLVFGAQSAMVLECFVALEYLGRSRIVDLVADGIRRRRRRRTVEPVPSPPAPKQPPTNPLSNNA